MAPICSRCLNENISDLECNNRCKFCYSCISRFVLKAYKSGKLEFKCPNKCNADISTFSVQRILQKDWGNVVYRKRMLKLNESGHQNLEFCPCCKRVAVLDSEQTFFSCLNPQCLKDICTLCRRDAHAPYNCEDMGHTQIGLCNHCGDRYFDNQFVEVSSIEADCMKSVDVVSNNWESRSLQLKPDRTFFGKVADVFTSDNCETIVVAGLTTLSAYILMRYVTQKL